MDASPASNQLRDFVAFRVADHTAKPSPKLKILIVGNDDRRMIQVKHQLVVHRPEADDSIKCAMHGLDGLVVAEEFQPELVIVHLGLPRRSGACTAKLIRGRSWASQVVIISHSESECSEGELVNNFDFHFFGAIDVPLLMQMYPNLALRRARCIAQLEIKSPKLLDRTKRLSDKKMAEPRRHAK